MRAFAILRDSRATSTVEFALIAPALLMSLLGLFEFSHNIYTRTLLEGAIQKAARDSTIEGAAGNEDAIDADVTRAVHHISPGATLAFGRKSYTSFTEVATAEDFTDTNTDGTCNANEPFEDANANGTWDADRGKEGLGSARDAVLYEVTVTYNSYFPVGEMIGFGSANTLRTSTVLRNQPYGMQSTTVTVGQCA